MKENGMLKIIFKKRGHPVQMCLGSLLRARTDEFTVLFDILKRHENQQSVTTGLFETEAEPLRSRVAALGITDVVGIHVGRGMNRTQPSEKIVLQSIIHSI